MDCTIIIPIGPGHQDLSKIALQSVMLASQDKGAFDNIHVIMGDDTQGKLGRSYARNKMALGPAEDWMMGFTTGEDQSQAFEAEWLFFLDADDLMCSEQTYGESAFKVAQPYLDDYDCIWGAIYEFHSANQIFRRKQVDRITTYKAYVKTPAPLSCQMGHFVRRSAFLEIGGFNEDLDVCEDVDLYLREWKELRCIKQEKPLFLNRRGAHSWMQQPVENARPTHTGRDWSIRAEEMLRAARRELQ